MELRNAHKISVAKPKGKRSLRTLKHSWEETEWDGVDWIHESKDRDWWHAPVNTVMTVHVP